MADVFISYARSTQPQAELIDEHLTSMGYSVWRDRELPLHRPYPQVLEERLREAKAVVVVWSKDAAASDWVRSEADLARLEDKLVQVSVDATLPPMPFNQIQCGDLSGWSGDLEDRSWRKLVASLSQLAPVGAAAVGARRAARRSPLVAVLPFDNLSGDADLLYFSDGVSEEILQTVSQTTGLRVIGRSSSFQFRGPQKSARRVAAELGCTHVLDGSVRRGGARVRISASLVECAGQTTLWSERFDRELSDVFALQDEIAAAVAVALKSTFAPSAATGPIDPIAYDLYLKARASTPGRMGAFDAAALRAATTRAPGFAQAWAALAITRALQATWTEGEPFEAAYREATDAADKALALDPGSGAAYTALALLEPICGRFVECEALYEKALAASPDDPAVLEKYSRWLHGVGRTRDARARIAHAYEVDPHYHQGANWYAVILSVTGGLDEAFEVWDRAAERWPDFDILHTNPLLTALTIGDGERVERYLAGIRTRGLDSVVVRNAVAAVEGARTGKRQSGAEQLALLHAALAETGTLSLNRLVGVFSAGFHDEGFALVERASFDHLFRPGGRLAAGDYGLHVLFNAGVPLRLDRRFPRLCAKLGLCDYWMRSGHWPDCADRIDDDFREQVKRLALA